MRGKDEPLAPGQLPEQEWTAVLRPAAGGDWPSPSDYSAAWDEWHVRLFMLGDRITAGLPKMV